MSKFKGSRFPSEIILQNIYCYLQYLLSYRDLEEMAQDRGLDVDHSTIQRWVVKYSPEIESNYRKNKHRCRNEEFSANHLPVGSGIVEAASKTLVSQRLKRSGMACK